MTLSSRDLKKIAQGTAATCNVPPAVCAMLGGKMEPGKQYILARVTGFDQPEHNGVFLGYIRDTKDFCFEIIRRVCD